MLFRSGVRCLKVLQSMGAEIELVVTHRDDPNEHRWYGSVAETAAGFGIPVIEPDSAADPALLQRLRELRPDFIFSFYYRHMIGTQLLATARRGALNMHGSLLPKFRGRAPVNWAVAKGATETGATLHYMVEKPDAGEIVGQQVALAASTFLGRMLHGAPPHSCILWGPPGSGKTTIARLLAQRADFELETMSAVLAGVKEVREVIARAHARRDREARGTILFVDEIHRFNKSQQDAFLPHVEAGIIVLVGATTENPSFEVTAPLLSRCRVVVLEMLSPEDLESLITRALADAERGLAGLRVTRRKVIQHRLLDVAELGLPGGVLLGPGRKGRDRVEITAVQDRKSTRLNSSHRT